VLQLLLLPQLLPWMLLPQLERQLPGPYSLPAMPGTNGPKTTFIRHQPQSPQLLRLHQANDHSSKLWLSMWRQPNQAMITAISCGPLLSRAPGTKENHVKII
jgi:hypothetical protein